MKLAKKLASVPLEYQASVYAKETRLIRQKQEVKKRENLLKLKNQLKALKERIKAAHSDELRTKLLKETSALEKTIKKAPHPRRQWSLILPGSFGSNSK